MKILDVSILAVDELISRLLIYGSGYIYRGQNNSEWDLKNGLERLFFDTEPLPEIEVLRSFENRLLKKFKSNAHLYENPLHLPDDAAKLGWLALMQHHGVPTRLVDFTTMPFMALFFAMDGIPNQSNKSSAIYCLSFREINNITIKEFCKKTSRDINTVKNLMNDDVERLYCDYLEKNIYDLVWCIEPTKMNLRLNQQGGTFVVSDDISIRFSEAINKNSIYDSIVIERLVFSHTLVPDIFVALTKMGISNKQIYPGLDGLSKDIKQEMLYYISKARYKSNEDK